MKKLIFFTFVFISLLAEAKDSFLYDIIVSPNDTKIIEEIHKTDVWKTYSDSVGKIHIVFSAENKTFKSFKKRGLPIKTVKKLSHVGGQFFKEAAAYHTFDQTIQALKDIEFNYGNIAKVYNLGTSCNEESVVALKISSSPTENIPDKKETLFVGAHHAREWISVEVPLGIAEYITSHYSTNIRIKEIVDNSEIWIIPILNPDGFIYSWESDRYWRKNRRLFTFSGETAYGVDLNRNYDFDWCKTGASTDPASEEFCGPVAFSEKESQIIKTLITSDLNALADDFSGLITYHAYGQTILYPWSYSFEEKSPEELLLTEVGTKMSEMILHESNKSYSVGQSSDPSLSYPTSGDTSDWFHSITDFKTTYTIELRPGGEDSSGFELDPTEIAGTVTEQTSAALYYLDFILKGTPVINTDINNNGSTDYFESLEESPDLDNLSDFDNTTENDNDKESSIDLDNRQDSDTVSDFDMVRDSDSIEIFDEEVMDSDDFDVTNESDILLENETSLNEGEDPYKENNENIESETKDEEEDSSEQKKNNGCGCSIIG